MSNYLNINPKAFGLDISDSSIKIIRLKKSGKFFKLVSWGETQIEPGVIENGEIKNENKFIELLKQALKNVKGKKINTKNAIVSLPEKKAFLGIIKLPIMTKEELQSAITFQAENYIPLPVNEVYFDFEIIPIDSKIKDHCDVLLVAFPKKIIDNYILVLKKVGVLPIAFETESQASTRVLERNTSGKKPFFGINCGKNSTIFTIFSDNSLRFASSIPISSQDLSGLCAQIKKYINYHQTYGKPEPTDVEKNKNSTPSEEIILCGSQASLKGTVDLFSTELKLPVKLATPISNILKEQPKGLPVNELLGYVTALGLSIRASENTYD